MKKIISALFFMTLAGIYVASAKWAPVGDKIKTRWAQDVTPENVWKEYPRPQLQRTAWSNLNGLWEYAITAQDAAAPTQYEGEILVPFCVESSLSGVGRTFGPDQKLWYRTQFSIDPAWKGKEVILHFGAVDWACTVWLNDKKVGEHKGGFDTFSFDISRYLRSSGPQQLVVAVTDPSSSDSQARGKQHSTPGGIWYTPVSGIWQTVWLEPVNKTHIASVLPQSDIDRKSVSIRTEIADAKGKERLLLNVYDNGKKILSQEFDAADEITFPLSDMKLWSPTTPHLYHFDLTLLSGKKELDKVSSYFAMRKISKQKDAEGRSRIALNNEILFQYGTLDQGWWPDGLHTPPSAEAMLYDMQVLKEMGFNTIRKHIKVEPALYYYYADSLGLMLWQDMPSGFAVQEKATAHVKANAPEDWNRPAESARQWETELKTMIDHLRFFPSIVTWVVFNEGWGQYETPRVVNWVKEYDTTRLINGVSGWADRKVGDMFDIHNYPGAAMDPMSNIQDRIQVLGEFGGLGLVVPDHIWNPDMRNWGYKNMDQGTALLNDYGRLMFDLQPLIKAGLSAAIYTQTTDVEGEVNGLMTYDREVVKLPFQLARMFHHGLYSAKPEKEILLVKDARMGESFKQVATDGVNFQRAKMPLAVAPGQTVTSVAQFSLDRVPEVLSLQVRMKNAVKVWLNGQLVLDLTGSRITRSYNNYNISDFVQYLKPGQNELRIENVNDNKAGEFDYSLFAF